tara:strand:- start:1874 stop:2974 length:1101 start_codon:yes stop_codon:yes gene_type:complete
MGFKCGIVGLPNVGKSTLFNALTQSNKAEAANYPFATIEPNVGRVPVPDKRLKILGKIGKSEKVIPSYMDFVDIAGLVKGASKGEGLGNKFLGHIREVDAIVHVVRCFEDSNITHVSSKIDPIDDIQIIDLELQLADIESLNNKKLSLEKKLKSNDKAASKENEIVNEILNEISEGKNIKINEFNDLEKKYISQLNLISLKPTMYVCNVDEDSIHEGNKFSKQVSEFAEKTKNIVVLVSASIEAQIAELENQEEKNEFLKEMNLEETTLNKVIKSGYNLLGLMNFFTCGPKETRSWTISKNTFAPQAAGKIHSDFEKGFIRAETISYNDYVEHNGDYGSREAGKLKQEGKDYVVKDGDVMNFLFNV